MFIKMIHYNGLTENKPHRLINLNSSYWLNWKDWEVKLCWKMCYWTGPLMFENVHTLSSYSSLLLLCESRCKLLSTAPVLCLSACYHALHHSSHRLTGIMSPQYKIFNQMPWSWHFCHYHKREINMKVGSR